ncbi:hypothetical protein BU15DRAFT_73869 [Melanogaster broomeanus]|nr:hypothetical protein BU15DRAFT_73869 [Melanogaster broomeanus]
MDQDAFRDLLVTRSSWASQSSTKEPALTSANNQSQKKTKSSSSNEPSFKPRKVKKADSKYRNRAAERREGTGNDYAEIEAVLEDFEKRAADEDKDVLEQQRKYLGGDSEHSILVRGLDMSLLEQNRARAAASTEDDEILEQAFAEAVPTTPATEPMKRTRQEIIRDLKAKRQNGNGDQATEESVPTEKIAEDDRLALEAAKKAGKFKPIGFKPIGQTEEKAKKRKVKDGKGDSKTLKKKRKVQGVSQQSDAQGGATEDTLPTSAPQHNATKRQPEPGPALLDEDFDIFAGTGDYEGFPDDDESDEPGESKVANATTQAKDSRSEPSQTAKGWFDEPDPDVQKPPITVSSPPPASTSLPPDVEMKVAEEEEQELRLKPLESSALPSIRDFLAIDEAAEKAKKRRARKEKKKKKKAGDDDDD